MTTRLGPLTLRSPLVAASGTVAAVHDFAAVASFDAYGAAVAKSVSDVPWPGRRPPRLAPAGVGMINAIGIQNPGIDAWLDDIGDAFRGLDVAVWGSAVGGDPAAFARVAKGLETAGVVAVEINLSCPNLEDGQMFALDPSASRRVVEEVRAATTLPIGAKLSPNAADIVAVAAACAEGGADWVVLTNTALGAAIDPDTRRPAVSAVVGGYSGEPLKPIALRCVWDVARALPSLPVVGCGGVSSGGDVVEYLLAGAAAVAIGTAHFAEPRVGKRIDREVRAYLRRHDIDAVAELIGAVEPWR